MVKPSTEERVLLLAPTARDAALSRTVLTEAGLASVVCRDVAEVCRELEAGAGAALLAEEALAGAGLGQLAEAVGRQPAWSDFPVVVLTREGEVSEVALRTLELLGNVTMLERPVRVPALVSAVRAALRARRRQYQIREHLAEAARLAAALRDADKRKDEFLATLAHELRNPLAPIRNALYMMTLADDDLPPAVRQSRDVMDRQVVHMVRLIDDLLDVSRITRGKLDLRVERVDLAEVVTNAIETSRPAIAAGGHEFRMALPAGPVPLDADPVRLAQVFSNLLTNAAKYTDPGGTIRLIAAREGANVVVRVTDTGIGIPAEALPRLFEMFAQIDRSLDRAQGGLGIGLSLVKGLVEMHGGTVSVRSDGPGRGSEFAVRLPIAETPTRVTGRPGRAGGKKITPLRVLVVDDNRDAADSLAGLLAALGHDVRTAHDGAEGLEVATGFRPAVVLMDLGMPRLNGFDAARRIRAEEWGRGVTLVALTGWGQDEDRKKSKEAGFDQHLVKPVEPERLRTLLAAAGR